MKRIAREWKGRGMFSVDHPMVAPKNGDMCNSKRMKTLLSIPTPMFQMRKCEQKGLFDDVQKPEGSKKDPKHKWVSHLLLH